MMNNTLEQIRTHYKKYVQEPHAFENGRNLLRLVASWILEQASQEQPTLNHPPGLEDIPNEPFCSLMEFYDQFKMCHPNSLATVLTQDPEFLKWCGKMEKKKYYIQSQKALHYLAKYGPPKLKKRAKGILEKRKDEVCQKVIPMLQQELTNLEKPTIT